jgi:hypothetical protein
MSKYKITKSYLNEFFGLFGKKKEDRQEKLNRLIDNDPILKQIDKNVSDMNNRALERLKKEDPELYKLIIQFK